MAEKAADIHTLAPRTSWLEDAVADLYARPGSGGLDEKHWQAALNGAVTGTTWDNEPWKATNLIYGLTSANGLSLHQTVFGTSANALKAQDGKGFYGQLFSPDENRWINGSGRGANVTLANEVFGNTGNGFVESLRAASQSLSAAIWGSPSYIGSGDTIIGRIQKVAADLDFLADAAESEIARLDARIDGLIASGG